jgi:hypothetical protein
MRKLFAMTTAIVAMFSGAVLATTASAAPATVYQMNCWINGVAGTGVGVQLGDDSFALTSCHTGDKVAGTTPIKSGTCTTLQDSLNVCAGNKQ